MAVALKLTDSPAHLVALCGPAVMFGGVHARETIRDALACAKSLGWSVRVALTVNVYVAGGVVAPT